MGEYLFQVENASTWSKLGVLESLVALAINFISPTFLIQSSSVVAGGPGDSSCLHLPQSAAQKVLQLVARPAIPSIIFGKFVRYSGLRGNGWFVQKVEETIRNGPEEYQVEALFQLGELGWDAPRLTLTPKAKKGSSPKISPRFASLVSDLIRYYFHDPNDRSGYGSRLTPRIEEGIKEQLKATPTPREMKVLDSLLRVSKCLTPQLEATKECRFIRDLAGRYTKGQAEAIVRLELARLAGLHSLASAAAFEEDPPMLMWALRKIKGFPAKDIKSGVGKVIVQMASTTHPYPQAPPCKFDPRLKTNIITQQSWEGGWTALDGTAQRGVAQALTLWVSDVPHPDLLPDPPYDPLNVKDLHESVISEYCRAQQGSQETRGLPRTLYV